MPDDDRSARIVIAWAQVAEVVRMPEERVYVMLLSGRTYDIDLTDLRHLVVSGSVAVMPAYVC